MPFVYPSNTGVGVVEKDEWGGHTVSRRKVIVQVFSFTQILVCMWPHQWGKPNKEVPITEHTTPSLIMHHKHSISTPC